MPEPMQLGRISNKFRQLAWLAIEKTIQENTYEARDDFLYDDVSCRYVPDSYVGQIFIKYRFYIREEFHTTIPHFEPDKDKDFAHNIIRNGEYDEVLTFIEHILRDRDCPESLRNSLTRAFEEAPIAYFLIRSGHQVTIAPRTSERTSKPVLEAIQTLHDKGMEGAIEHFHQAAELIRKKQYLDAIHASMLAAEWVARKVDPVSSSTLAAAVKSLIRRGITKHPLLMDALVKLYAFASDTPGVRHGREKGSAPNVGLDEAMLLFGTCACFTDYLASKHQQLQQQTDGDS